MSTINVKGETLRVGDTIYPGTPQEQTITMFWDSPRQADSPSPGGKKWAITDVGEIPIDNMTEYPVEM